MNARARLLGPPAVAHRDEVTSLPPGKTAAVLYYLAYQGDWVGREDLLVLLWPDRSEERARSNLRQLLTTLRRLPFVIDLVVEPTRLRWNVASDVRSFQDALARHDLAEAVAHYRGPLLAGFRLPEAPEFESWLELEREALHRRWRSAALELVKSWLERDRAGDAVELLERVRKVDRFDEEVVQAHLQAVAIAHGSGEALATFERFRRALADEMGGEPEASTLELVETIRQRAAGRPREAVPALATREVRPARLPRALTPFVGRGLELELLEARLQSETCRLMTLLGPGGMGKTRLALELAHRLREAFRDGVAFAALAGVAALDGVAPVVAGALGLPLRPRPDPLEQVRAHLEDRELLLVLDNLEHLPEVREVLLGLLGAAPGLTLLLTSREKLGLGAERVHDLEGLSFPERDHEDDLAGYDAVALFLDAAARADDAFTLTDANAASVARICRLTGGMPLALELAASWLRVLPVAEVASELAHGIDLLEAGEEPTEARHRSVRAAFEGSWERLTKTERDALRCLSVFKDGFTRESALAVAGAGLPLLLALRNKSFLTLGASGRFDQHPLLAQYTRERANEAPEDLERARVRHAEYICRFLEDRQRFDRMVGQRAAFLEIERESGNVLAAWAWAAERRREDILERMVYMLYRFMETQGRHHEFLALVDAVLPLVTPDSRLVAHLHHHGARLLPPDQPGTTLLYQRALELFRRHGSEHDVAKVRHGLAVTMALQSDPQGAQAIWREVLPVFQRLGAEHGVVTTLNNLAALTLDARERERLLIEALAHSRRLRNASDTPRQLSNLAEFVASAYGDYRRALSLVEEAMLLERDEVGSPYGLAGWLGEIAQFHLHLGDLEAGEQHLSDAFPLLAGQDHWTAQATRMSLLESRALLFYFRGDMDTAWATLDECAALDEDHGLVFRARLALDRADHREARRLALRAQRQAQEMVAPRDSLQCRAQAHLLLAEVEEDDLGEARRHVGEASRIASEFTFVPIALDAFVTAAMLEPSDTQQRLLHLAASHPAADGLTRKRAEGLLGITRPTPAVAVGDVVVDYVDAVLVHAARLARLMASVTTATGR